jgi:hypothetical protein
MEDSSDDDWVGVVLERGRACNFNCIPFGDGANAEAVVVVLATAQSAADDDILKILDSCIAVDLLVFYVGVVLFVLSSVEGVGVGGGGYGLLLRRFPAK